MAERMAIKFFLICICLSLLTFPANAASTSLASSTVDPQKECTMTLTYSHDGAVFSGLNVKLYRFAEVSADFQYTLTPAFAGSRLSLNGIQTAGEWNVVRSTLETYVLVQQIQPNYKTVTDSEGKAFWDSLPTGLYLAVTDPVIQNDWSYAFDSALLALPALDANGVWQYDATAKSKCEAVPPMDPDDVLEWSVVKLWKGDQNSDTRPSSIEVEIFRNGVLHKTVTLSEENQWSYSWSAKQDGAIWNASEKNVPAGYTATVEERGSSFVLTNTKTQKDPDTTPPSTGDSSNILLYIFLMNFSGILLILLGVARRKRL